MQSADFLIFKQILLISIVIAEINARSRRRRGTMNSNEIAALAHVSRSTVSRVVNHYPNVPEETRRKVQEIIDRYGYTPSTSARTLAGKSNDIIGVFFGGHRSHRWWWKMGWNELSLQCKTSVRDYQEL